MSDMNVSWNALRNILVLLTLLAAPAAAQTAVPANTDQAATTGPSTAPATQPAVNHLRTPHAAIQFFLETVDDTELGDERYVAALPCLDFGAMDEEKVRADGPEYVRKLAEILARLKHAGAFDPADEEVLPDEPAGTVQSFGRDPLVLELKRIAREVPPGSGEVVQEWRFPEHIVSEIPRWHTDLDGLTERMTSEEAVEPTDTGVSPEAMRTAHHTIRFFLEQWNAAQDDGTHYASVLACMDFTDVARETLRDDAGIDDDAAVEEALQERGPEYVVEIRERVGITYADDMKRVLQAMLDDGSLDIAKLPDKPEQYVKPTYSITSLSNHAVSVTLVRQGEDPGQWRFNARTVRDAPRMVAALENPVVEPVVTETKTTNGAKPAPTAAAAAPVPVSISIAPPRDETASPRATLKTFYSAMDSGDLELAVSCLDISELSEGERELAPVLAGKLWLVMTRHQKILVDTLSDNPDAPEQDPLFPPVPQGRVQIRRERSGDRKGEWLFSSQTVRDIEQLFATLEGTPIHETWSKQHLPFWRLPSLYMRELINARINDAVVRTTDPDTGEVRETLRPGILPKWLGYQWRGLQAWQWCGLALTVLLGFLVRSLSQLLLPYIARPWLQTEQATLLPAVVRRGLRPTSSLAMVATWWGLLQFLDLGAGIMTWVWWVLRIVMALVAVCACYRLIDLVMEVFKGRASRTASRLDDVLVPLLQKTLKVVVVTVGLIFIANIFGFRVTPLLAGLGVGGLAFGLAAQDTLKNFFGSVNVVLDRPFQVGDWVKMGDIEGTVESVGLRSSRIRTFYNSQVTVPNSTIMTAQIDNMGRRKFRRISCMLSVTYGTPPEKLEAFTEGIRELVRQHPYTRKDYFHCYVNAFAASSIDVMLYVFLETPDWGTELREKHRLFLDIIRLAKRVGVEFAFPTQTIHLSHEDASGRDDRADVPTDPKKALEHGRQQAGAILAEFLPEGDEKPPPVTY
ncbi:MAG: mechanosensitive ion channel family protein [Phycisphaerae bacterium]|nr:mechanosensitive ion channel family protein [Phycisphaerae bacterium]